MKRVVSAVFLLAVAVAAAGEQTAYMWTNSLRREGGLPPLAADPLLERVARSYARELAERGCLRHRDEQGRSALDRYRAAGGTAVLVGEILGSGPGFAEVAAAWQESLSHRQVVLAGAWTHCGGGWARRQEVEVWVLLFSVLAVERLELRPAPGGLHLSGRLRPAAALAPLLYSGLEELPPLLWRRESGEFQYFIPRERAALYHRLGYRSESGKLKVTDAFFPEKLLTSDPGTAPR